MSLHSPCQQTFTLLKLIRSVGAGVGSGVGSGVGPGVGSGVGSGVGAGVGSGGWSCLPSPPVFGVG